MLNHLIKEDAPPSKRFKPSNAPSSSNGEPNPNITASSAEEGSTHTTSTTTTKSLLGVVRAAEDSGAASSPPSSSSRDPPKSTADNQPDQENEKMLVFLCGRASIPYEQRSSAGAATTTSTTTTTLNKKTRTKAFKFPMKLFYILECGEFNNSVSWTEDGKAFQVLNEALFIRDVLPAVFKEAKFASFHRKLNRWHFQKLNKKENTYMHPRFMQGRIDLCQTISVGNNGHPLLYDNLVEAKNQQLHGSASGNNSCTNGSRRDGNNGDIFAPNGGAIYMPSDKKPISYGIGSGTILPPGMMTGGNSSSTAMLSQDASLLLSAQHQMAQRRALLGAGMGGNYSAMTFDAGGANDPCSTTGMAPQGMQSSFLQNQGSMNRRMQDPSALEMGYLEDMMYMGGMTGTGQQQRMQEMNRSMNANLGGMQFGNIMDSGLTNQGFGLGQQFQGRPNMPQIRERQFLNQNLDQKIGQLQFLNQNLDTKNGHRQFLNQNLDAGSIQFSNQQYRRMADFNPHDGHDRRLDEDFNRRDSNDGKPSAGI